MNDGHKMARLKNGTTEALPLVAATLMTLETLLKKNPIVFYDLVMLSRHTDGSYNLPTQTRKDPTVEPLIQEQADGKCTVHETIRNIVVSAVQGDEMDMHIAGPIDRTVPSEAVTP